MEFNSIMFPAPKFNHKKFLEYDGEIVYIPKKEEKNSYIPCLLLLSASVKVSNKFLIFFHGNAEDIFGARDICNRIREILEINIIIVEYPTYSIYTLEKDPNKMLTDSLEVFDFILNEFKAETQNIFIFGRSIGTTAAIYLSSKRKPGALISVSGFTSIKSVAQNVVGKMLGLLVKERFTSKEYIKNVTCPTLFIHGQKDTLIPFSHSLELKDNCSGPYEILLPEEMTHNEFDYDEDLIIPVKNFLDKNTGILAEGSPIVLPKHIFDIPLVVKKEFEKNHFYDSNKHQSCTDGNC